MNGVSDDVMAYTLHRPEIPLARPASVDEVAAAVVYLAHATYVTGVSLTVDGGLTLTAAEANARYAHDPNIGTTEPIPREIPT